MTKKQKTKQMLVTFTILYAFVVWAAVVAAPAFLEGVPLFAAIKKMNMLFMSPFQLRWLPGTPKVLFVISAAYFVTVLLFLTSRKHYRFGEEHGSAVWGDIDTLCRKYQDHNPVRNVIFTKRFGMSMDMRKTDRNLLVTVIGGPGTGKSRYYVRPNVMQCNSSYIITDPKGELLRSLGHLLEAQGYEIRVFDIKDPQTSMRYNPFRYVRTETDILTLIENLIRATTPKDTPQGERFWEDAEKTLLQALMLYLWEEGLPREQNFAMISELLVYMGLAVQDKNLPDIVDHMFQALKYKNPKSVAVKQYELYKSASEKTASSIILCAGVRISKLTLPEYVRLLSHDEMDFESIGERKVALFLCIPVNDGSMNFLVSMLYSQLFQVLMHLADTKYNGRLPMHVKMIMDEFANVALPDDFTKVLSTIRSYEISCSIIIQAKSQLEKLFKQDWETIIGNCDELLYLGGNEPSTHKMLSDRIGKETIHTKTFGRTRGRNGSSSSNEQLTGRELLDPSEIAKLKNEEALVYVRGEAPIRDQKYDLEKHRHFKDIAEGGSRLYIYAHDLHIPRYLPDKMDRYEFLDMHELDQKIERNQI